MFFDLFKEINNIESSHKLDFSFHADATCSELPSNIGTMNLGLTDRTRAFGKPPLWIELSVDETRYACIVEFHSLYF